MKRVICVGDSIRWGYEPAVVEQLKGWAQVTEMGETQGGDTRNVIAHLDEWVCEKSFDVVHLNAGLHDMIREVGPGSQTRVPLAEYRQNLKTIFGRVRERTKAKLIFALTTPVNLSRQLACQYPCNRINEDVLLYNAAAVEAAAEYAVKINDLYGLVMTHGMDRMHDVDGVHFTSEVSAILGAQVAAEVRAAAGA